MFEPYSSCLFNTENTHIIKILRFCIVVIEAIGMLISAILKCELQNVHIQLNLKAYTLKKTETTHQLMWAKIFV